MKNDPTPSTGDVETPTYPDPSSDDPRERDLDTAHEIDPESGRSDDPRLHGGRTSEGKSSGDDAWQNEFTEETMPSPEAREDSAHSLELDPN